MNRDMTDVSSIKEGFELPKWGARGTAAATFAGELSFENVSMSYGPIRVLDDISFELKRGEIICLLGPSGCGKTSLLRLAAGIERPEKGRIILDGQIIADEMRFLPPEKRNIGLMFQEFALFPHLTILENVAFGLKALSRSAAREEATTALKRVGLEKYLHQYPHSLSGGEQQRVALARAIVPRPAILLMDEPFSGLDQRLRDSIRQETLALLRETRATSILVTHDPLEAMSLADRILLLRNGRLVQSGTPEELFYQPVDAEAARFFSDFNEITAVFEGDRITTALGTFPCTVQLNGSDAIAMIRPNAILPVDPQTETGLEGVILESRFLGEFYQLTVQLTTLERPLIAHAPLSKAPGRGDVMRFGVRPDGILVFEAGVKHA